MVIKNFLEEIILFRERQYGALEKVQALELNDMILNICLPTVFCVAIDILLARTLVENNTY